MSAQRYTGPAIALHWLIAAGIVANVALAWVWPHLGDTRVRPAIDIHKSIGVTVLGLAIMRLLWRLTHRPPGYPAGYKRWERTTSHAAHAILYALIFAMPLSGWIMDSAWKDAATHPMAWFGLFPWPRIALVQHFAPATRDRVHDLFGEGHVWASYALYALVALHVAGALKHQLLDGSAELQRMWPRTRRAAPVHSGTATWFGRVRPTTGHSAQPRRNWEAVAHSLPFGLVPPRSE